MNFFKKSLGIVLAIGSMTLYSCVESVDYTALSEFYYSEDGGSTYGNRKKEFYVGETVYMQLITRVDSTSDNAESITVTLIIPRITALDATYFDGQKITPIPDEINNITTYNFIILASDNSLDWNFVFQFVPNSPGIVTLNLTFDDKVPALYDKQNTIDFISPSQS
jgi:hypothetical protein